MDAVLDFKSVSEQSEVISIGDLLGGAFMDYHRGVVPPLSPLREAQSVAKKKPSWSQRSQKGRVCGLPRGWSATT
jgi:hypothetical protein